MLGATIVVAMPRPGFAEQRAEEKNRIVIDALISVLASGLRKSEQYTKPARLVVDRFPCDRFPHDRVSMDEAEEWIKQLEKEDRIVFLNEAEEAIKNGARIPFDDPDRTWAWRVAPKSPIEVPSSSERKTP